MAIEISQKSGAFEDNAHSETAAGSQKNTPPKLRSDLNVHQVDNDPDGAPAWVIHDQFANRYFRIGAVAVDMLSFVDGRDAAAISKVMRRRFGHVVDVADVESLFAFLRTNYLVAHDTEQEKLVRAQRQSKPSLIAKLTRGYISFRIPLVHPDKFLDATVGLSRAFSHPAALAIWTLMGVLGLFLVARQWDVFLATLVGFVSIEGLLSYTLIIVLVKVCHELGHAYAAKQRGLRVPTIGVAFIVFWPIAYTDTTDAWRLDRRRDRLAIGIAGVGTEMAIACIALFLWNLMPDSPFRSVLFLLATTTWLTSLLINLNPLMRFDGYYIFSDLLRIPNLEQRANAVGRWQLRRTFLGITNPCPEPDKRWLAAFSFAVWIYRFFLFLGIALAVYYLFFKALGILLAALEIVYFIGLPAYREMKAWPALMATLVNKKKLARNFLIIAVGGALMLLPWQTSITAPAVLKTNFQMIYAPEGGQIENMPISNGGLVDKGDLLLALRSPELDHSINQAERRRAMLRAETSALGVDAVRRESAGVLQADLSAQTRTMVSLAKRQASMRIVAPFSGKISALPDYISSNSWVSADELLFSLVGDEAQSVIEAYVVETNVSRLEVGTTATFYADAEVWPRLEAKVTHIDPVALSRIDDLLITSSVGGSLLVRRNEQGEAKPLRSIYKITLRITSSEDIPIDLLQAAMLRGTIVFDGKPESIFNSIWLRAAALFRRESGF